MKTEASYLNNPSVLEAEGLLIQADSDELGSYIVLDRTPAYPQGGGQPGDHGILFASGKTVPFFNTKAFGDTIYHFVEPGHGLEPGTVVKVTVDAQLRKRYSILHSAGHLLACLSHLIRPELIPVKGHHFPDGSYIELNGPESVSLIEVEQFLKAAIRLELAGNKHITTEIVEAFHLPESPYLSGALPEGKPIRLVTIEGHSPMACAGTHVQRLSDMPAINVTKLKWSKGLLKINYNCFEDGKAE